MLNTIRPDRHVIEAFCKRHHIIKLALFGSVLREDFRPDSDIDVLVEFDAQAHVGLMDLSAMQAELSEIFKRTVHLVTPGSLSRYFRDEVIREAEVCYVAA